MAPAALPASPSAARSSPSGLRDIERAVNRLSQSARRTPKRSRSFRGGSSQPFDEGVDEWGTTPPQREAALAELRTSLSSHGVPQDKLTDWHTLLRFLRAREYDIKKTVTMYMDHLKWRKENDVDNVLETFDFKEREQYLSVYPQGYYNTDREGRPVTIQHLGQVQPKRIMQITTEERMIRFHVQEYERFLKKIAPICSRLAGHHIDQSTTILDVKGVTIGMLSGDVRKVLSAITGIAQDHYPETMKRTIIINAPMSFRFVFAVVKPLLQPRTVNKITLLGTKYMDDLAKSVDPKNIPTYLGGGCKATLLEDPGPWNDEQALLTLRQIEEQPYSEGWGEMPAEPARGEAHTKAASDVKSDVVAESPPLVGSHSPRVQAHQGREDMDAAMPRLKPLVTPASASAPLHREGQTDNGCTSAATLLERVQELEEKVREHGGGDAASGAASTQPQSLLGRVQLLESAMVTLLEAQTLRLRRPIDTLDDADDRQSGGGCCCCTIM